MQTTFEASKDWGSGLVGSLLIENNGATALDTWTITFESTFEIDTSWGGDVLSRVGNRYTIGAKGWNSRLEPGIEYPMNTSVLEPTSKGPPWRMALSTPIRRGGWP